ncbi:MAG: ATP-binding cassette domain-containing protein [Taibaiella sp.]|nr:ATP-binding cassette domain-containing protein [Taibaiella sp.]
MHLSLQNVIPGYLSSRAGAGISGIWGKDILFNARAYVLLQAPSGSGKTTLVHILYGMPIPYSGAVCWGNEQINQINDKSLSRLRAGHLSIIFQDLRLFPNLTVWENIEIKRLLSPAVSQELAEEWLSRLGIHNKIHVQVGKLSYGEQQRVAIVRALVQPFNWLLMDEPFSHLDSTNRNKAITLIAEVAAAQQAGLIIAALDTNDYFPYTISYKI